MPESTTNVLEHPAISPAPPIPNGRASALNHGTSTDLRERRNIAAITGDINDAIEFVQERVINRSEVIEQIFLAMLIGEHVLLESRTGVGKTLLAEQIFRMFDGARTFKVQASKEQQPDTYFGGLLLDELKQGRLI